MARERGLEFKVGLLIIIATTILVGFVFVLGNFSLSSGFTIKVQYQYSGNLQEGAPVKVAGIKVGKVKSVEFVGGKTLDARGRRVQVVVTAWVEEKAREAIRQDATFFVNTAGVLGEQYLEIVPGEDYEHPPLDVSKPVVGENPPRTDLLVSELQGVLENLGDVLREDKDVIRDLLVNSSSAVKEVNKLLVDNREQLGQLIGSTSKLADQAGTTLEKVNQGLGDPRVIRRTVEHADALLVTAQGAITSVTPAAVTLIDDATRVTGIITEERVDKAINAADKAATAAVKAGGLIDNVDGMVTDLRKGKGTAGALLVKEEVYADLRELIRDLKRNPWKFFWKE
jgi:phospholipid/cholesterol/gamma-HCH transport system substrate-binding protein